MSANHANHGKVEALFHQALQFDPSQRPAFLAGACGNDATLRAKLEELLQAQSEAGPFLAEAPNTTAVPASALTEQPGDTIGRYKLREKVGEGGCGVVYVAEQEAPVRRRVALKVIKPGMDTHQVIARFEAERQALAMMDHPNIAKVLDGGTTDMGRPYFVMELVRGIRITDYCDQSNLSTRERLDLFIQVCQAVQHAHQKGIIHRDLKPSNILVTLHDGVPVPKVIDFGIAKATEGRLTEATVYTELHQFMGTPAYMSPEQAEMSGLDIDTRSDIYSLGVLLYQLLTGKTPFDGKELLALGIDEMRRTIREKEPMRPSTRLATLQRDELTTTAKRRSSDAPRLIHLLKGDLDWIVMKALEKDRTRRYETASGLATDIQRHLTNEPVVARPPSTAYRLQKLVRRNRAAFAAAGVVAAALVIGAFVSTWQAVRATRAEREKAGLLVSANEAKAGEEKQRHVAERNAAQAQASAAQAQATVTRLEIDRAEMLFANEQSAEALAYLARVLRREPTNRVAGERILSALAQRNFCVPLFRAEHKANVTSAEFSPDGQRILTASKDGTARIWDGRTGQPLLGPFQHASEVTSAHFSPDGARVVTTSLDQTARFWDARTGLPASTPLQHEASVTCADFSPNGQLVTGSADGLVHFWNTASGKPARELVATTNGSVKYLKFSPDDKWLAVGFTVETAEGGSGRYLRGFGNILDAASSSVVATSYQWFDDELVPSTVFRPDDLLAANIGGGSGLNLISMADRPTVHQETMMHDSDVLAVRFSPDGQTLATGSKDSTLRIWDGDTLQPVGAKIMHEDWVNSVDFSPDGRQLVTGAKDRTGRIWDVQTRRPLCEPFRHDANVLSVRFSPDGGRILSRCDGPGVWVWEVRCGGPLIASLQHTTAVRKAVFSPDGQRVAATDWLAMHVGVVRLWDARPAALALPPLGPGIWDVGFSRDGNRLFATDGSSGGRTVSVWNSKTGTPASPPIQETNMTGTGFTAQISPDGQLVLLAGSGYAAKVWRVATGSLVSELPHQGPVNFSRFSPDGQWVVTTSADKTARLWHWETGRPMTEPLRHDGEVVWVDVSPDGRLVATLSRDRTARIWEAASGRQLQALVHAQESYHWHSIQFSPDGLRVATATGNVGQVWDVQTGQPVAAPFKHHGRVNSVRFSPDGQRLLTACHDGSARIWDVTSGHLVSEPLRHRERVNYAEFSPDGHWVVTASQDGTARIWEVPALTPSMPLWLADWADAVAGYRIDLQDTSQSVGFELTHRLRQALAQSAQSAVADEASRWASWFYADKASRTISPGSLLTTPQLAQQRIDVGTLESLQQAVRLSPTNGLAQARLAWLTLTNEATSNPRQQASADWQSRQAVALAPHDSEVRWARAQVCERIGKLDEALQAADRASALNSTNALFWNAFGLMLEKSNRLDDALNAFTRAITLSGPWKDTLSLPATSLLNRSKLLQRLQRWGEAGIDNAAAHNIPQRMLRTPANFIDLSLFYNRGFDADMAGVVGYNFGGFPRGRQSLKGTEFDLRGFIELADANKRHLPERINAIQVNQKARRLCFLHAGGGATGDPVKPEADGTKIGAYLVHYADGTHEEIAIVYGEHLRVYNGRKDSSEQLANHSVRAWRETNAAQYPMQVFKSAWENPHAEKQIQTIDFASTVGGFRPVLFAITAEP